MLPGRVLPGCVLPVPYISYLLGISPAWDLAVGRPTAVKNILLSPGLGLIRGYSLPRLWLAKAGAGKDGAGKVKKTIGFSYFLEEN